MAKGPNGELPPNNWEAVFGGPAWERVIEADGKPGQWYLHLFAVEQPDLNWENQEVKDHLEDVLKFWLDRGVDGFRIDVAHGMVKEGRFARYQEGSCSRDAGNRSQTILGSRECS
jgi:alpha-glucosidase